MGASVGGSRAESQQRREDRLAIPEDVAGLRRGTFDFLSQMLGGPGTAGTQTFGAASGMLNQLFQPGFGGQLFGNALQGSIQPAMQQITQSVLPQVLEQGLLGGMGGGGSSFASRFGQGVGSTFAQFMQPALQAELFPFQAAAQFAPTAQGQVIQAALGGADVPVLTSEEARSRSKAFNFGIGA